MEQDLLEKAKSVLNNNWTGQFTKPAPSLYPHQWNWDAGFIAIGYAHYDFEKAKAELRSLFRGQWANGMVPQIVFRPEKETDGQYFPGADFWQSHRSPHAPETIATSGITMPPVHGFALWQIYQYSQDEAAALSYLKEMYPKVKALHQYLYSFRDPLQEGLIYIRHPWEPGTDNSPTWDQALEKIQIDKSTLPKYERKDLQNKEAAVHRPTDKDYDLYVYLVDLFRRANYDDQTIYEKCPFLIQDPLFNAILVHSNEALIEIALLLGEDISELLSWNERTIHSMNDKMWNETTALYDAYDLYANERIPIQSSSGLIPLFGGIPTVEQSELMVATLKGNKFSGAQDKPSFLCPTYNLESKHINYQKYWRGPIWVNMNWMLYKGLLRYYFIEEAEQIKADTLELIEQHGFYEYFDPRKSIAQNAGYGTDQFSWSAALCIDFLLGTDFPI